MLLNLQYKIDRACINCIFNNAPVSLNLTLYIFLSIVVIYLKLLYLLMSPSDNLHKFNLTSCNPNLTILDTIIFLLHIF